VKTATAKTKTAKKPAAEKTAKKAVVKAAVKKPASKPVSDDPEFIGKTVFGDMRDFAVWMFDRILYRRALTAVVEHVEATSARLQFTPAEAKQWNRLYVAALAENDPMHLRDHQDRISAFWSAYYRSTAFGS
jgi:hypothetical protein